MLFLCVVWQKEYVDGISDYTQICVSDLSGVIFNILLMFFLEISLFSISNKNMEIFQCDSVKGYILKLKVKKITSNQLLGLVAQKVDSLCSARQVFSPESILYIF